MSEKCDFSGLTVPDCQASICDCFRDIDPDDPSAPHSEVFTVTEAPTPPAWEPSWPF